MADKPIIVESHFDHTVPERLRELVDSEMNRIVPLLHDVTKTADPRVSAMILAGRRLP